MPSLGQLVYKYFHKPILAPLKDRGGLIGYIKVAQGKKQMQFASTKLRVPDLRQFNSNITVVGVAGKANWYQMIFCLYSFYNVLGFNLKTVIIDDGSIDDELTSRINKQVPFVTIIKHDEARLKAEEFFSTDKYPVMHSLVNKYVVFKKLFHARALISGTVLVLDADMLFYKSPCELIEWMEAPDKPVYMYDKFSIYGNDPKAILEKLAIKHHVNTGIIGFNNNLFDFEKLEELAAQYLQATGFNYLMEQGLYAMYLNDMDTLCLSPNDYEILPLKNEAKNPKAVMHHYPTESRNFYFRYAWRHVA